MSYDVTFGPEIDDRWRNYTSNVAGMWHEAIGISLGDLIETVACSGDLIEPVERGIAAMKAEPDKYRAMEPSNGWGDYEGALGYLEWIASKAREHPNVEVSVSR